MISRILLRSQRFLQLFAAFAGAVMGAFILLSAVQFYFDLQETLITKSDLLGNQYLVIQKNVEVTDMLSMESPSFADDEIDEIEAQEFVKEVGKFESSLFEARATMAKSENLPHLNLDLFFEAVPDQFIDVKSEKWKWKEGDERVPVILPTAYLDSYNFGFAPSRNLPPVTEKMATSMQLALEIEHYSETFIYRCRVIGVSDRINSLLVPLDFLRFANEKYRMRKPKDPSRLILAVDDITNPQLALFLEENEYSTNEENLRGSRIKSVLNIVLSVFLIMGCIIVALAILGFIQYSQLMIGRVNAEIKILISLGYSYLQISWNYIFYLSALFAGVLLAAWLMMLYAKSVFDSYVISYQFEPNKSLSQDTILVAILFFSGMLAINSLSILLHLRKLAKNL